MPDRERQSRSVIIRVEEHQPSVGHVDATGSGSDREDRKRERLLETPTVHRPVEIAQCAHLGAVMADLVEDAYKDLVAQD